MLVPLLTVLAVFCAADAFALSCSGKYISLGMLQYEVLDRCGEPVYAETWADNQYINPYPHSYPQSDPAGDTIIVPGTIVAVAKYERWVYNPGPNRFMPILIFRNGKLLKISQAGYGY